MKKVVSFILVIALLFALALPTSLFAEEKESGTVVVSQDENGDNGANLKESVV